MREQIQYVHMIDQLKAKVVEEVAWSFANFENAGQHLGYQIREGVALLKQLDCGDLLGRLLEIGLAEVLEEVNRPADDE